MSNRLDEFFAPLEIGDLVIYDVSNSRYQFSMGIVMKVFPREKYEIFFVTPNGGGFYMFHSTFLKKL